MSSIIFEERSYKLGRRGGVLRYTPLSNKWYHVPQRTIPPELKDQLDVLRVGIRHTHPRVRKRVILISDSSDASDSDEPITKRFKRHKGTNREVKKEQVIPPTPLDLPVLPVSPVLSLPTVLPYQPSSPVSPLPVTPVLPYQPSSPVSPSPPVSPLPVSPVLQVQRSFPVAPVQTFSPVVPSPPASVAKSALIDMLEDCKAGKVQVDNMVFPVTSMRKKKHVLDIQVYTRTSKQGNEYYVVTGGYWLMHKDRLPPNVTINKKNGKRTVGRPRYLRGVGYSYVKNADNYQTLARLYACVLRLQSRFEHADISTDPPYLTHPKTSGILQWDVECILPEWMEQATEHPKYRNFQWKPEYNPSISPSGVVTFKKSKIVNGAPALAYDHLSRMDPTRWSALYPGIIQIRDASEGELRWCTHHNQMKRNFSTVYQSFLKDIIRTTKYTAVQIHWSRHARFMHIDRERKTVTMFDPWMQDLSQGYSGAHIYLRIKDALGRQGWTLLFIPRAPDQGGEGSCVAQAMMRTLLISQVGISGATIPIPCEYVVFTGRLISIFRNKGYHYS